MLAVGLVALTALVGTAGGAAAQEATSTPEDGAVGRTVLLRAGVRALPEAPAILRLDRTTLAPGATLATPEPAGPRFILVEAGRPVVVVEGAAVALPTGEGTGGRVTVPIAEEVTLEVGDRLALPAATPSLFRNDGIEAAVILIASIEPQRESDDEAATDGDGIERETLGQGRADALPAEAALTLERFVLVEGLAVPAAGGPVLVAVEAGGFGSTVESGDVQISEGGAPGEAIGAAPGEVVAVRPGDALFFPRGMAATPPLAGDGEVVLLRFGVVPIELGTPEPTGDIPVGSVIEVVQDEVRLRDAPSLAGALVAALAAGQTLTVTGPAERGDGLRWYPVVDAADPTLVGYVAADFVVEVAEG